MIQLIKKIRRKLIKNATILPKYFKITSLVENKSKVLDFGCWQGDLSKILIEKTNAKVYGCDLIKEPLFQHKNFFYKKVRQDSNNIPFNTHFDYVIFADVLEHLQHPKDSLEKALKKSDKVIVSIPNLDFFLYRLFPKLENPPIELTPHINHWTLKSFESFLPKQMKINKVLYCTDFPELRFFNYFPFKNKRFFNQTLIMEIVRK